MKQLIEEMVAAISRTGLGQQTGEVAYAATAAAATMVARLAMQGKACEALVAAAMVFLDYANELQARQDATGEAGTAGVPVHVHAPDRSKLN